MANTKEHRPIYEIAAEIEKDWTKPSFAAIPYLKAMRDLNKTTDRYFAEDAKTMVLYFLSNASSWRGETARRIKAELKDMVR